LAANVEYDVIVLDVGLPQMDGWRPSSVSVTTTAPGSVPDGDRVEDRVRGLEPAPTTTWSSRSRFPNCSLAFARCSGAASSRSPTSCARRSRGTLLRRRVERNGHRIDLTAKEYALLLLLLRRTGEVLSRTLIAEQVWDMNFDSDTNVVEVAVRRLRAKIDDPFDKKSSTPAASRAGGLRLRDVAPGIFAPVARNPPSDAVRGRHRGPPDRARRRTGVMLRVQLEARDREELMARPKSCSTAARTGQLGTDRGRSRSCRDRYRPCPPSARPAQGQSLAREARGQYCRLIDASGNDDIPYAPLRPLHD
jgi:two-component system copper resistance phosphate regulon response regulator CusR